QEIVEARNGALRRVGALRGRGDQLDAIASGDDQPLADHFAVNQFAQRAREARFGERQTLAHLDRGRFMTGSDYNYAHTIREWGVGSGEWGREWLLSPLPIPHSPLSEEVVAAQRARAEPGQNYDREACYRHPGRAAAAPAGGHPVVDREEVNDPGDERHHFFRVVVPVAPVALVVPEDACGHAQRQQYESD